MGDETRALNLMFEVIFMVWGGFGRPGLLGGENLMEKDSFVLYNSYYDLIEDLDMEQRGTLLTAILEHSLGIEQTDLDPITKLAYRVIASQLDRDRKKWERTCKKRAEAGRKGGIASGQARSKTKQKEANEAKASKTKQSQANEAEYEYESENDYEDDYEDDYENESEYVPPETDGFLNSIKERFIESFGRKPDRPFLSGIRNKLAQVSKEDVLEVIEIAKGKQPGNPEAYIMAALKDRGQREEPLDLSPDDPDRPLEQWEQDWIADVQRRREQMGGTRCEEA